MHRLLTLGVIGVIVLTGLLGGVPPAAVHGAPAGAKVCKTVKKHGKKHRVCTQVKPSDQVAKQLATTIEGATTNKDRERALLSVFQAIHIGVYNGKTGRALIHGMETNSRDVYFYDAELSLLSAALARNQQYRFNDLAQLLTSLGIQVDAATVGTVVQALVKWGVKHPGKPAALIPLLVRDLGLKHNPSYDLATVDHPETVQLDPLQLELINLYLLGPIQHQASRAKAVYHARFYGICTPIKVALNPFNPNTYLPDSAQIQFAVDGILGNVIPAAVAEFIKEVATFSDKWGGKIGLASTIASALHGLLLAYGLKVESGPTGGVLSTHYGPAGHAPDAGKQLQFQARVVMQDKLPDWLRNCLHQAGYDVPDQGPVPGVGVSWSYGGVLGIGGTDIEDYGTVTYNPTDEKTSDGTTGPKGVETMNFTPKSEAIPGIGKVITATGGETPRALWGIAFTNPLGTIDELLFPMEGPELDWAVTYHKPRGYTVTLHAKAHLLPAAGTGGGVSGCSGSGCVGQYLSEDDDVTWVIHRCGSDAVGPWQVDQTSTTTDTFSAAGPRTSTNTYPTQWYLKDNGDFVQASSTGKPVSDSQVYAHLQTAPPATVTMHWNDGGGYWTTSTQDITGTVQEDTSCPDNSDQP